MTDDLRPEVWEELGGESSEGILVQRCTQGWRVGFHRVVWKCSRCSAETEEVLKYLGQCHRLIFVMKRTRVCLPCRTPIEGKPPAGAQVELL